jgi:hypothetical protein
MWYGPYLVAVAELFPENSRGQAIGYTGTHICPKINFSFSFFTTTDRGQPPESPRWSLEEFT